MAVEPSNPEGGRGGRSRVVVRWLGTDFTTPRSLRYHLQQSESSHGYGNRSKYSPQRTILHSGYSIVVTNDRHTVHITNYLISPQHENLHPVPCAFHGYFSCNSVFIFRPSLVHAFSINLFPPRLFWNQVKVSHSHTAYPPVSVHPKCPQSHNPSAFLNSLSGTMFYFHHGLTHRKLV